MLSLNPKTVATYGTSACKFPIMKVTEYQNFPHERGDYNCTPGSKPVSVTSYGLIAPVIVLTAPLRDSHKPDY